MFGPGFPSRSRLSCLAAGALSAVALLSTGCGVGSSAAPADIAVQAMSGSIHGGQSPIQGATVSLYHTDSTATGYGTAGVLIGTATSDVNGAYTISPSATSANCPAGQQAYITASGGYQSGQPTLVNSNMLLVAALGSCSSINSSTYVIVNELTTVAAAYALSGFMTTSANGSTYVASVSAPAANNSSVSAITATAPAGLAHAFTNAANLVSYTSGLPNSSATASAAGATVTGHIPVAELNTLADAMAACVNTGSTNGNLSAACSTLFSLTPSISGVTPTNTLQAFLNLARNPYPSTNAIDNINGLLGLTAATSPFQPVLTTSPTDWSLAVDWNGGPASATTYYLALDANDTVYAGYGTTSATTPALYAVSAYGIATPTFAAPSAVASTPVSRGIATDTNGNLYLANNAYAIDHFSTSTGALVNSFTSLTNSTWALAVDKANNVWAGHVVTTAGVANVEELSLGGNGAASNALGQIYYNHTTYGSYGIAVDAFQDVWPSQYYNGGTTVAVVANTGSAAAPNYGTSNTSGTGVVSATLASGGSKPYQTVFDTAGNGYQMLTGSNTTATTGFEQIIPGTGSTPTFPFTAVTPQTATFGTTTGSTAQNNTLGTAAAVYSAIDGAGTIFIPDNNSTTQGIHAYLTQSPSGLPSRVLSPTAGFKGCNLQTTSTTCGTGSGAAVYSSRAIVIDSTGSVWSNVTSSGLVQIIGLAAPSYPQLSLGNWSLEPGMTATATLP